jgi:hypothetical protein
VELDVNGNIHVAIAKRLVHHHVVHHHHLAPVHQLRKKQHDHHRAREQGNRGTKLGAHLHLGLGSLESVETLEEGHDIAFFAFFFVRGARRLPHWQ